MNLFTYLLIKKKVLNSNHSQIGAGLACDLPSDISWIDHILNHSGNGRS